MFKHLPISLIISALSLTWSHHSHSSTVTSNDAENKIISELVFADDNLQSCVQETANKHNITQVKELKKLSCMSGSNKYQDISIETIAGISQLTSLEHLNLSQNKITDISALSNLISLEYLGLRVNQITDISALSSVIRPEPCTALFPLFLMR